MRTLAKAVEREAEAEEPSNNCILCSRLVELRCQIRKDFPDWHNAPVPSFGDRKGRLLIVGLAPGMKGANRTGRPFVGDSSGDLLFEMLTHFDFARGNFRSDSADTAFLRDCLITNAVRCLPPQNKPSPREIDQCRPFLAATISAMPRLRAVLLLGRIAHDSTLRALNAQPTAYPFSHGAVHKPRPQLTLFGSFHCSRYNINTGRLTPAMFMAVFEEIRAFLRSK